MRLIDADTLNERLVELHHREEDEGRKDILREVMWVICHLPTQPEDSDGI